ncbi:hypothetical protein scyTo_0022237 [Scyliorhinus torazame]|uniref:Uncharacterized protein n=1 Tax=Scyliorhinus torazame TaxID=75743 RepID=A0A401Q8W0_SCYTO|nr:hypothetical protein [Scyliorhinus torazame]
MKLARICSSSYLGLFKNQTNGKFLLCTPVSMILFSRCMCCPRIGLIDSALVSSVRFASGPILSRFGARSYCGICTVNSAEGAVIARPMLGSCVKLQDQDVVKQSQSLKIGPFYSMCTVLCDN